MTTSKSMGSFGMPTSVTTAVVSSAEPLTTLTNQVERLTTVVGLLEARLVANELERDDHLSSARPPPAPPFTGIFTATTITPPFIPTIQPSTSFVPPFVPPVTSQYIVGLSGTNTRIPQTLTTTPPFIPMPGALSGHSNIQQYRPPVSRPQMVTPGSCWGPPPHRQQSAPYGSDYQHPKSRLDPPRFDGSDANNWIRGIQYYFDHIGTPENQRLHYVIPLFEPQVADWIWNYCSSHESVTWFEFLDDVRRRFDSTCYQSHIGLMSNLKQIIRPRLKHCRTRLSASLTTFC